MPEINETPSIDNEIEILANATYGEEVRGAIIDALTKCYTDVVEQTKQGKGISDIVYDDQTGNITFYITDPSTGEITSKGPFLVKGAKGDIGEQGPRGDAGIPEETLVIDGELNTESGNPIANSAVANALNTKISKKSPSQDGYIAQFGQNGDLVTSGRKPGGTSSFSTTDARHTLATENAVKNYTYSKTESDNKYLQEHQDLSDYPTYDNVYTKGQSDDKYLTPNDVDDELDTTSTNLIQNQAVANKIEEILENYDAPDTTLDVNSTHAIQNQAVARALNDKVGISDFSNTIYDCIDEAFTNTNGGIYYNGQSPDSPGIFVEAYESSDNIYTYFLSYVDSVYMNIHRIANITYLIDQIVAVDSSLDSTSTNPVENRIVTNALDKKYEYKVISGSKSTIVALNDYTDEDKIYIVDCNFQPISGKAHVVFVKSVSNPIAQNLFPYSAQFIFAQSGRMFSRTTDGSGAFQGLVEFTKGLQIDDALSGTSENPVQNKVIKQAIDDIIAGGIVVDAYISSTSENPVQNKVIYTELGNKESTANKDSALDPTTSSTYDQNHYPNIALIKDMYEELSGSISDVESEIPTVPTNVSSFTNDAGYLTQHQDISGKENTSNKVTSISSSSTDTQYPSAKCVYDLVGNIETLLSQV